MPRTVRTVRDDFGGRPVCPTEIALLPLRLCFPNGTVLTGKIDQGTAARRDSGHSYQRNRPSAPNPAHQTHSIRPTASLTADTHVQASEPEARRAGTIDCHGFQAVENNPPREARPRSIRHCGCDTRTSCHPQGTQADLRRLARNHEGPASAQVQPGAIRPRRRDGVLRFTHEFGLLSGCPKVSHPDVP